MTKKKLTLQEMFIRDAGEGFGDLQKTVDRKNFEFLANRDVKNWKQFETFCKKCNITPTEAAAAIARHVRTGSNWNKFKIIREKSELGMIKALINMEKQLTRKRLHVSEWLLDFSDFTGYKIPKNYGTFDNQMTAFRKRLGLTPKPGKFSEERMLKEAARKLAGRKRIGGKYGR